MAYDRGGYQDYLDTFIPEVPTRGAGDRPPARGNWGGGGKEDVGSSRPGARDQGATDRMNKATQHNLSTGTSLHLGQGGLPDSTTV